jgi:hypothetical protein
MSRPAARYHISEESFRRQFQVIRSSGARTGTVGEYADGGGRPGRFDLVELRRRLARFAFARRGVLARSGDDRHLLVGKRHFAVPSLLRDAHSAGMELGTHGVTHRFLSDLPAAEISVELASSKAFLEDLLGAPVKTASVPGGGWSPLVASHARECGYAALCTSRPGVNDRRTDPFALRRVASGGRPR